MSGKPNFVARPVFKEAGFRFSGEVPDHIERMPTIASFAGAFSIFGAQIHGAITYGIATDIPDESIARLIAKAKANYMEDTIHRIGHTDHIFLMSPNLTEERVYEGRYLGEF